MSEGYIPKGASRYLYKGVPRPGVFVCMYDKGRVGGSGYHYANKNTEGVRALIARWRMGLEPTLHMITLNGAQWDWYKPNAPELLRLL